MQFASLPPFTDLALFGFLALVVVVTVGLAALAYYAVKRRATAAPVADGDARLDS